MKAVSTRYLWPEGWSFWIPGFQLDDALAYMRKWQHELLAVETRYDNGQLCVFKRKAQ